MQSQLALFILGALAISCIAQEPACTATDDDDDDRCAMLQGNVDVTGKLEGEEHQAKNIHHAKGHDAKSSDHTKGVSEDQQHAKNIDHAAVHLAESSDQGDSEDQQHAKNIDHAKGHDSELSVHNKADSSEGWPDVKDIMNKVKHALGGAEKLEESFVGVKDAVVTFKDAVHGDVKALLKEVDHSKGIDFNKGKVEQLYNKVNDAAKKLWEAFKKVIDAWKNSVGKVAPKQLTSAMDAVLEKASAHAKIFADSFKIAAEHLNKMTNQTLLCATVKKGLHSELKKASELAKSVTGLSTKGFSKELEAARAAAPEALKVEINKVLEKANDAADHILSKLTPAMKEITHGVTKAFKDLCPNLHSGAGRLEVGLLSGLVIGMLSLSM